MQLTKQDEEMFQALAHSSMGSNLVAYLERLSAHICDARSWKNGETMQQALLAEGAIRENLINKILPKDLKKQEKREFYG